jgi:hypothetical protein
LRSRWVCCLLWQIPDLSLAPRPRFTGHKFHQSRPPHGASQDQQFINLASKKQPSLFVEFCQFIASTRRWWLAPVMLALVATNVLTVVIKSKLMSA